jgi:hypothetical protein
MENFLKDKLIKKKLMLAVLVIIVLALLTSYYFYNKYQKANKELQGSGLGANVQTVVNNVGKLIVLPTGETPQVASVKDKNQLPKQPFFAQAKDGDIVLIYTKAKEAILYRPSINKIITIGPINITPNTPSASISPILTPTPTLIKSEPTVNPGGNTSP